MRFLLTGSVQAALVALPLLAIGMLAATSAVANPQGGAVVNGAATFSQPNPTTLEVTNSPNAIINWQQFNIGANETTRFIQQSASSAVMNRVVGVNPSEILGQLQSNGRVYLINPNGIVFGHGAVVDTAAFIGATLNMADADFLTGKLRFDGPEGAGGITNHGVIKARDDGGVYLVAPEIENDGIIRTDEGQILLAAGRKLTISSLDVAHISFEVQAPDGSVVNLGELLTAGGAASVFAQSIHNSGRIRASGVSRDAQGRIVLNAGPQGSVKLTGSS
jgi:filamentous hemagglutinin family protein